MAANTYRLALYHRGMEWGEEIDAQGTCHYGAFLLSSLIKKGAFIISWKHDTIKNAHTNYF